MKSKFRFLKTEQNQYYIILPSISNETEYYFFYANLSQVDVEENQEVSAGGVIGHTGQSGNANDQPARMAHLHFEVRNSAARGGGNRIDPSVITELNDVDTWPCLLRVGR